MKDQFTYEKVTLDRIEIDARYQRELKEPRAKNIAASFDEALADTPWLSLRSNGKLYCIDGQHTVHARRLLKHKTVLVRLYRGLTPERESELFTLKQQNRRSLKAFDLWRAELFHENPVVVDINNTVINMGLRVAAHQAPGVICAVRTLRVIHALGVLKSTLFVMKSWGNGAPTMFESAIMRCVASFLVLYPEADLKRLVSALRRCDPVLKVTRWKGVTSTSERYWDVAASDIRNIYNYRLPRDAKLPTTHQRLAENEK